MSDIWTIRIGECEDGMCSLVSTGERIQLVFGSSASAPRIADFSQE
jgi:hypothetical protein